jgi:hypothetical protein
MAGALGQSGKQEKGELSPLEAVPIGFVKTVLITLVCL